MTSDLDPVDFDDEPAPAAPSPLAARVEPRLPYGVTLVTGRCFACGSQDVYQDTRSGAARLFCARCGKGVKPRNQSKP